MPFGVKKQTIFTSVFNPLISFFLKVIRTAGASYTFFFFFFSFPSILNLLPRYELPAPYAKERGYQRYDPTFSNYTDEWFAPLTCLRTHV